ncbi:hypothetical protein RCL1_008850 [Eukaryota sp. TZLM3-RCL]
MSSVETTLQRIANHPGVIGYFVLNSEGVVIKHHGFDQTQVSSYAHLVHQFSIQARTGVRDIDPTNQLSFLRIRSKDDNEIIICPENDLTLVVVQTLSKESSE